MQFSITNLDNKESWEGEADTIKEAQSKVHPGKGDTVVSVKKFDNGKESGSVKVF